MMKLLVSFIVLLYLTRGAKLGTGPKILSDVDFFAAAPYTYNHVTGGGAVNDMTIGRSDDIVRSLEGGDFKCNDVATHFVKYTVGSSVIGSNCATTEFTFTADTTGLSGVAYGDVPYFQLQFRNRTSENGAPSCSGNCANGCPNGCNCDNLGKGVFGVDCSYSSTNNNEYASYVPGSKYFTAPMFSSNKADMHFQIEVCGLEAREVIVLRLDVKIYCLPNSNPKGNLQAGVVQHTDSNGNTYQGTQRVPLKGVDLIIGSTGCTPVTNNPISATDFNSTITIYKPSQSNGGSYNMFLWYSWSKGAYRLQSFGATNFTEVHTFDTECSFLHDGTVMFTQATCGCQATFISNAQPQLFFSVNSSYYYLVPVAASLVISGITYQVWNYSRTTSASSVTQLYILRSDNVTLVRADFYDGEYWIFSNYKRGNQVSSNFQVATGTNNKTDCECKKTLDIMVVIERTARVTRDEWGDVATFVGESLPDFTSTCSSGSFGFNDVTNPSICIPGVNFGLSWYDSTNAASTTGGIKTLMKFQTGGVRGTNPTNVRSVIGAEGCVGSGSSCGLGTGNLVTAINSGVDTLLSSDRTASKVLLLVNKGIENADPVAVATAVANAATKGVQVFALTYYSTEFISDMRIMVKDPDNFVHRANADQLTVQNYFWPMELVSKMCTPAALPCGTCCGQCEPTCGTCLTTPLNCPSSTNCSYTSRNTAAGCCVMDYDTPSCPPKLTQCTFPPTCDATTGQCTYVNSCGGQATDQPNCYNYSCIANVSNPTGQYICSVTPKFSSDACTKRTCVNNAIVSTPKSCTSSDTACFTAVCSLALNGACVLTNPKPAPGGWNFTNKCNKCDPTTGYFTQTCSSSDLCNPQSCDPNTGQCNPKPVICTSNATFGKCNSPTCLNGECVDHVKACTAPTGQCKVCANLFSGTGCCDPLSGNCTFTTKTCSGNTCPCGSPFEVCSQDVCACPSTCAPTKAPTKAPTPPPNVPPVATGAPSVAPISQCSCPAPDQCQASVCDPAIGTCNVMKRNCTLEAINDGIYGSCITVNACDPHDGCTYDFEQCSGGDICSQRVANNSADTCCQTVNLKCPSNECYSYFCQVPEGCVQDDFLCHSSNLCKVSICNSSLRCTTRDVVCQHPNTECIVYSCNSGTGECEPQAKQSCDDNNACTIDSCDDETGCVHTPVDCPDAPPDDKCHSGAVCNPNTGSCEVKATVCDDGIVCTDDTCDPDTGCVYSLNNLGCQDTNPCVNASVCTATGCQSTLIDCGGEGLFCTTTYCQDYFGCTVQPTDCQANATNETCSYSNCSEALRECETIEKPCLAFLGVIAGLVVAGVAVGVVAAALLIAGAAAAGGAAAVSQSHEVDRGQHVNMNPLYNQQTVSAAGLA